MQAAVSGVLRGQAPLFQVAMVSQVRDSPALVLSAGGRQKSHQFIMAEAEHSNNNESILVFNLLLHCIYSDRFLYLLLFISRHKVGLFKIYLFFFCQGQKS